MYMGHGLDPDVSLRSRSGGLTKATEAADQWVTPDAKLQGAKASGACCAVLRRRKMEAGREEVMRIRTRGFFAKLRGLMVAMLVESGHVQGDTRRHEFTPSLPADSQQAIVDEIVRQHRDLKHEIEEGDPELREHLSATVRGPLFPAPCSPQG